MGTGSLLHDAREVRVTTEPTMTRLTARYDRAVTMARTLHAIDVRKGTNTPYLAHVLSASAVLVLEPRRTPTPWAWPASWSTPTEGSTT